MLIDISQPLTAATPMWPGDTAFDSRPTWVHGPGCPVAVAAFTSSTHAGTHADAPLHYDPAGAPIDAVPLDAYVGPVRVVDLRGRGPVVTPEMLAPALETPVERILLRTYDRFPHAEWQSDFMSIAAATIEVLAAHGVVLIGTDAPSLDPQDSKTMDAHHAVRAADMRILEGLVLDSVEPGDYELIALPLRLAGLDAAPVRAVLRPL
jgi:arylformamidase